MNTSSPSDQARKALQDSIQGEVQRRLDAFFGDNLVLTMPKRDVPTGTKLAECYETDKEYLILGQPDSDDESHNCDAMGCGTMSHVLVRVRKEAK